MAELSFSVQVDADDLAFELSGEEAYLLDLFAAMATEWSDVDFRRLKRAHSLSKAHKSVAPFLEHVVEALRQAEAAAVEGP